MNRTALLPLSLLVAFVPFKLADQSIFNETACETDQREGIQMLQKKGAVKVSSETSQFEDISDMQSKLAMSLRLGPRSTKPALLTCPSFVTPKNDNGGGNSFFFDRHNVQCGKLEFSTSNLLEASLLANTWTSIAGLAKMSGEDKRNHLIVKLNEAGKGSIKNLQKKNNHELASMTQGKLVNACLFGNRWKSIAELAKMSGEDKRNTIIVELNRADKGKIGKLQKKDTMELLSKCDFKFAEGKAKALSQWHLGNPSKDKMQFDYTCCSGASDLGRCRPAATKSDDAGGGNTIFFDRHDVKCDQNEVLAQWKFVKTGDNSFKFDYTCCTVATSLSGCASQKTPGNEDGGGKSAFLDRHDLKCPPNKVMTQWKMVRKSDKNMFFDYTCCAIEAPPPTRAPPRATTRAPPRATTPAPRRSPPRPTTRAPTPAPPSLPVAPGQQSLYEWFHADCTGGGNIKVVRADNPKAQAQCDARAACTGWSEKKGTGERNLRSKDCKELADGAWIYFKKV